MPSRSLISLLPPSSKSILIRAKRQFFALCMFGSLVPPSILRPTNSEIFLVVTCSEPWGVRAGSVIRSWQVQDECQRFLGKSVRTRASRQANPCLMMKKAVVCHPTRFGSAGPHIPCLPNPHSFYAAGRIPVDSVMDRTHPKKPRGLYLPWGDLRFRSGSPVTILAFPTPVAQIRAALIRQHLKTPWPPQRP